jgi:hypothetical protein
VQHVPGTLAPQDGQRGTQHVKCAEEACVEKFPRLPVAGALNRTHQREAGIIEVDVDAAELPIVLLTATLAAGSSRTSSSMARTRPGKAVVSSSIALVFLAVAATRSPFSRAAFAVA